MQLFLRPSKAQLMSERLNIHFLLFSDSDSDSELSVDEHSSSYASSHSSDSEDEARHSRTKWNNERTPIHSTPKGACSLFCEL